MIGRFISGLSMVYGRYLQCEAPKIAKLVYKSNNYGFMVLITIVTGAYKPTYNWGASHCSYMMGLMNQHNCEAPDREVIRSMRIEGGCWVLDFLLECVSEFVQLQPLTIVTGL